MKYLLLILMLSIKVLSQEDETKEEQQPFDLPETIIYGKDYISIKAGVKQYPDETPVLSGLELDSLNSLEKQQSLLLPQEGLPKNFNEIKSERGYLKGNFGRFTSSEFEAGLPFSIDKFDLFVQAGLDISSGHTDNADFARLYTKLFSDYIADPKFWIFGGSKTRSSIAMQLNRYNNYSVFDPNSRSLFNSDLGINTDGSYNGFDFKTGVNFDLNTFDDDSIGTNSRAIGAYLKIFNPLNQFRLGFILETEFRSELELNNNFYNIGGNLGFVNETVNLQAQLTYQVMNADSIVRSAPSIIVHSDLKINNKNTFKLDLSSGLERTVIKDLFPINPYLSLNSFIDHKYNLVDLGIAWNFHPSKDLSITIGGSFELAERHMNWVNIDSSFFSPNYVDGFIISASLEGFYNISDSDKLDFFFKWQSTSADSAKKAFTYIPELSADLAWNRDWTKDVFTQFKAQYVGERFVDVENNFTLDPYVNVSFLINYRIFPKLSLTAKAENLANQNIYVFNYFIERGTFGSVGVVWNF